MQWLPQIVTGGSQKFRFVFIGQYGNFLLFFQIPYQRFIGFLHFQAKDNQLPLLADAIDHDIGIHEYSQCQPKIAVMGFK